MLSPRSSHVTADIKVSLSGNQSPNKSLLTVPGSLPHCDSEDSHSLDMEDSDVDLLYPAVTAACHEGHSLTSTHSRLSRDSNLLRICPTMSTMSIKEMLPRLYSTLYDQITPSYCRGVQVPSEATAEHNLKIHTKNQGALDDAGDKDRPVRLGSSVISVTDPDSLEDERDGKGGRASSVGLLSVKSLNASRSSESQLRSFVGLDESGPCANNQGENSLTALVRLYSMWPPQLTASYRPGVDVHRCPSAEANIRFLRVLRLEAEYAAGGQKGSPQKGKGGKR